MKNKKTQIIVQVKKHIPEEYIFPTETFTSGVPLPPHQAMNQYWFVACQEPDHTAGGERPLGEHYHLSSACCQFSNHIRLSQKHEPYCELCMWGI